MKGSVTLVTSVSRTTDPEPARKQTHKPCKAGTAGDNSQSIVKTGLYILFEGPKYQISIDFRGNSP